MYWLESSNGEKSPCFLIQHGIKQSKIRGKTKQVGVKVTLRNVA